MRRLLSIFVVIALAAFGCDNRESLKAEQPEADTPSAESRLPDESLRRLIADAREHAPLGDAIWPGYSAAPFGVLLVEEDVETLFCHDGPATDFEDLGVDSLTGCAVKSRSRTFEPNLLAAFPAVDGISTIVIGTPEATGQEPLWWQVTILHEHFHQMQASEPDYYSGVAALDLAGGDQSGMWMLNYPFPYASEEVGVAFNALAAAAITAVEAIETDSQDETFNAYVEARKALRATVSDADWRYFEFQLWQEGIARWTEIAIAASSDQPEFQQAAANKRKGGMNSLISVQDQGVKIWKRSAFYAVGATEGMLLDARRPDWRARYFEEPFALAPSFEEHPDE